MNDNKPTQQNENQSLDALKGFAVFWIIGGAAFFHSLSGASDAALLNILAAQLENSIWDGFRFYDILFPLFMFVCGVGISFPIDIKTESKKGRNKLLKQFLKRALLFVLLGIIYNNKLSFDFSNLRYASVLGQIGIAYFFSGVIYLFAPVKWQFVWIAGILLAYWAAMFLIPVPGFGAGVLTPSGNLSGYIDRLLLPGKMLNEYYDPQGILPALSAIPITLAGTVTGKYLKNNTFDEAGRCRDIAILGVFSISLGFIWNICYPINKEIWSSSFNVLTIGISMFLMSLTYYLIDVKKTTKWFFPLIVIGKNAVTIYMVYRMIDFYYTSEFMLTGIMSFSGRFSNTVHILGVIILEWILLYFFFKKNIYFRSIDWR